MEKCDACLKFRSRACIVQTDALAKLFAIARTLVGGGVRGEGNGGRREIEKTNTRKWWENG